MFTEIDRSDQCVVSGVSFDLIYHTCDSKEGSSGSPLFDKTSNQVVGINWGGGVQENGATMMAAILADIKERLPDFYLELTISHQQ